MRARPLKSNKRRSNVLFSLIQANRRGMALLPTLIPIPCALVNELTPLVGFRSCEVPALVKRNRPDQIVGLQEQ